ncbi:DUF3307 domain-containing protein [Emticicia sp. CRIBPO]|uniref:DUF3307 domain-containing protein n=1 Tax=Emticicia sp. CRIBPO TaxID=2683258 RepID=UPI001411FB69|nr:DUF3307 domain-containing protein [Emticicia sp. CRIBPO]NBA87600.1 DUF3307 domain-containing protein [Emticicia sp. CRIBPO]
MLKLFTPSEIAILIKLLLAHALSDYFLQPSSWVEDKRIHKIRSVKFYFHIAVTFVCVLVFTFNIWAAIFIALTHYLIDLSKIYLSKNKFRFFIIDQLLHLVMILITWLFIINGFKTIQGIIQQKEANINFWAIIMGYAVITFPLGVIIDIFIHRWRMEIDNMTQDKVVSLSEAGKWIGIMERILILTFILAGQFSAIGFLIAAKAILRFKDSDLKQAEYVLIGTLMSFTSTILIGIGIKSLLTGT